MAETYFNLLQFLHYGKSNAITAEQLQHKFNDNSKLSDFKRKIRSLANEARKNGHKVIGDDNGYYIALNLDEWQIYKHRRFASFADELKAFAAIEKISVKDLIKNVYHVNVIDENYELF